MTYSDFLPVFMKEYKNIKMVENVFITLKDKKEAEIKMCEGFAVRKIAIALYPHMDEEIMKICTQIRCDLKNKMVN
tara:strand:+ start:492 stop:719 length:228 start_codon:yes stop_codon:yes gene_type:complete